jgi:hypothetical protein
VIDVKQQILAAFDGVESDPDQTLHQAQYTDSGMSDDFSQAEYRQAAKKDNDKHWQEIPVADLIECDAAMSHATLQNWRYFLAAILWHAVDAVKRNDFDDELLGRAFGTLHYREWEKGVENTYYLNRFATLTMLQIDAIKSFLQFCEAESLKEIETSVCYWQFNDVTKKVIASYWVNV